MRGSPSNAAGNQPAGAQLCKPADEGMATLTYHLDGGGAVEVAALRVAHPPRELTPPQLAAPFEASFNSFLGLRMAKRKSKSKQVGGRAWGQRARRV